ncbi:DUF3140 domain-containing protein [Nocardia amikacinitolerans]|uniref:DUF3140 domain-containing protein n=1 Tax=Nocardia amikacinitolerans TaxID=756689 RepID=UPI00367B542A
MGYTARSPTATRYTSPAPYVPATTERKGRFVPTKDDDQAREEFGETVDMTAKELGLWLDTDQSKSVGQKSEGAGESTGLANGRRIIEIRKNKADLRDDDYAHMRKFRPIVQR